MRTSSTYAKKQKQKLWANYSECNGNLEHGHIKFLPIFDSKNIQAGKAVKDVDHFMNYFPVENIMEIEDLKNFIDCDFVFMRRKFFNEQNLELQLQNIF